jgi:hypothetical protein
MSDRCMHKRNANMGRNSRGVDSGIEVAKGVA